MEFYTQELLFGSWEDFSSSKTLSEEHGVADTRAAFWQLGELLSGNPDSRG